MIHEIFVMFREITLGAAFGACIGYFILFSICSLAINNNSR